VRPIGVRGDDHATDRTIWSGILSRTGSIRSPGVAIGFQPNSYGGDTFGMRQQEITPWISNNLRTSGHQKGIFVGKP
jgi:hypothetical protein